MKVLPGVRYAKDGTAQQVPTGKPIKPVNIDSGEWHLYRLVVEKVCSWTELSTSLTIIDVANLNEALDIKLASADLARIVEGEE